MKYYLDEDLSPKIAEILRKYGTDAVSAHEVSMLQSTDMEQLDRAASEDRCLVTSNRNDFIRLTVQFFNEHRRHAGVLIIPHTLPADKFSFIAKSVIKHHSKNPKDIMEPYTIDFLES